MTECHPVAATRLKRAKRKGARMIVADPRRIALAEMADLYLPLRSRHRCRAAAGDGARDRPRRT
jgi:predicted molibdopterin-dependent oxidoreductase YjgC